MFCRNCETEITELDTFCNQCGAVQSVETDTPEAEILCESESLPEPESRVNKKNFRKETAVEFITVLFIGITTFCIAWATCIEALHKNHQTVLNTDLNIYNSFSNSLYNQAALSISNDMLYLIELYQMETDLQIAKENNADDFDGLYEAYTLLREVRESEELSAAIEWASDKTAETGMYVSPFEMEGFVDSYYEKPNIFQQYLNTVSSKGNEAGQNANAAALARILFAMVMFMLGIKNVFIHKRYKMSILCVSVVIFVFAFVYMLVIPMPEGFSFFDYIGGSQ